MYKKIYDCNYFQTIYRCEIDLQSIIYSLVGLSAITTLDI